MLKVAKFGGSSLSDSTNMLRVRDIVLADEARKVIVVSAPGKRFSDDHKLTDLLYLCHAHLTYGVSCDPVFELITSRFLEIRDALHLDLPLEEDFAALRKEMNAKISQDYLVSRGEYFSARIMAALTGFDFLDAADWLTFSFDGSVDTEESYKKLRALTEGKRVVTPGFYGALPGGRIKLLDRGGSDISGAYAAAALDADVYENWTDVSGILMADPRIVPEARPIARVTYSELRELSYIGAQVLHEATVFPVREKNITLNIRNTRRPEDPGTLISEHLDEESENEKSFITGFAGRKGFDIITVTKNGMSSEPGAFRRILELFEKYRVPISYAPSGIDCYSVVAPDSAFQPVRFQLLAELQKTLSPDHVHVSENIAIVAVVGRRMVFRSGSSGKIFTALGEHGINIRMILQGPEELNILIGVKEKDYEEAIRVLYSSFSEQEKK